MSVFVGGVVRWARKAPTGVIQMLFATKEEAQKSLFLLIDAKAKRGYVQTNQDNKKIGENNEL